MASTGTALFLSLQARTEQLEKDFNRAKSLTKDYADTAKKHGEGMVGVMEKIGLSGHEAKEAFKNLAAGLLLSAGQIEGVGETAKGLTQTLGAFLSGGPIAGGIVGLSFLFKGLAESTSDTEKAAKKSADEYQNLIDKINTAAAKAREEFNAQELRRRAAVLKIGGVDVSPEDLGRRDTITQFHADMAAADARMAELRRTLAGARTQLGDTDSVLRGTGVGDGAQKEAMLERRRVLLQVVEASERELGQLKQANEARLAEIIATEKYLHSVELTKAATEEATSQTKQAASAAKEVSTAWSGVSEAVESVNVALRGHRSIQEKWAAESAAAQQQIDENEKRQTKINETVESILASYRDTLAVAQATTDEERDRLSVLKDVEAAKKLGASQEQLDRILADGLAATSARRAAENAGRASGEKFTKGMSESIAEGIPQRIDPIFDQMGQTIASSLTDAIMDGITNGGRGAEDIFRNLLANLARMALQSALSSVMSSILGGGGGGGIGGFFSAFLGGGGGGGGGDVGYSAPDFTPTTLGGGEDFCPT